MPPHHLLSRCAYGAVGAFCGFGLSSAHADAHPARRHHGTGFSLLATPNMRGLASEILEAAPELFEEGGLSMATFNDGTPKVAVDPGAVMHKDVVLLADYDILHGGEGWVATLGLIYSLPRYRAHSLTVVLPFFPMGTMERVLVEGEVATAMTFARMLSATPQTMHGPTQFLFYDIHSLQNRFYFSDQVLPLLTTAIPLLKKYVWGGEGKMWDVEGQKWWVHFLHFFDRPRIKRRYKITGKNIFFCNKKLTFRGSSEMCRYPRVIGCSKTPCIHLPHPPPHSELQNLQAQGHDVAVAFPDDGAKKRFWPEFQVCPATTHLHQAKHV